MYISSDTNVWVDFQIVGAIKLPFLLSHKFYISDETLQDELLTPSGIDKTLVEYGLIALELTEQEFYFAYEIIVKHPQLSRYDALALSIAKTRGFVLLTGDRRLRTAASEAGVQVRGTIWVFDELLRENVLSEREYVEFMKELLKNNNSEIRLPSSEIETRIARYNL